MYQEGELDEYAHNLHTDKSTGNTMCSVLPNCISDFHPYLRVTIILVGTFFFLFFFFFLRFCVYYLQFVCEYGKESTKY